MRGSRLDRQVYWKPFPVLRKQSLTETTSSARAEGLDDSTKHPLIESEQRTHVSRSTGEHRKGSSGRRQGLIITMKGRSSTGLSFNPQIHYILRLCYPDAIAKQVVGWTGKLAHQRTDEPLEYYMDGFLP